MNVEKRRDMADWEKQIFAINLIVGDLERSKTFYREVFGLLPLHEAEDQALFRFTDMYVMSGRDSAHRPGRRRPQPGAKGCRAIRHRR